MKPKLLRVVGSALGVVATLTSAHAQNEVDVLRYSMQQTTGTSRTQALGGAGSSLGADLGALVVNPANLGNYRRSEFSLTPGLLFTSANSTARLGLNGAASAPFNNDRNGFNIANFGVVIVTKTPSETDDWQSGAIGINFSRMVTHAANRTYQRALPDSAASVQEFMTQYFEQERGADAASVVKNFNDNVVNDFADLAYNGYLLNFGRNQQGQTIYFGPSWGGGGGKQEETTEIRGAQNQIDIGYGASYRGKLYIGGSLGILTLRYKQTRTLKETVDNPNADLKSLSLADGYEVNGGGINLRLGMVWRPVDAVRLGLAIQTPSWYSELKEQDQQVVLQTDFNRPPDPDPAKTSTRFETSIAANAYQYTLTTPFRATGGLTLIGGKFGLLTGDVEYVNYGSGRLGPANNEPNTFQGVNNTIDQIYASTVSYRVGVELRPVEVLRLRAGYGYYGSPYVDSNRKGDRTVFAAGAGLRFERGYVDFGISQTEFEQRYSPYTLAAANEPVVTTKYKILNPTITVGFTIQ